MKSEHQASLQRPHAFAKGGVVNECSSFLFVAHPVGHVRNLADANQLEIGGNILTHANDRGHQLSAPVIAAGGDIGQANGSGVILACIHVNIAEGGVAESPQRP
ncbi:MAG: hypothetical protein ACK5TH_01785 [Prosthecobacter sp.]